MISSRPTRLNIGKLDIHGEKSARYNYPCQYADKQIAV